MIVYVELTNLVQNLEIDSKDLDIIGQRCSLMPSFMLGDATLVRSMVTPGHLRPTIFSSQFKIWRMDVVGPISPPSSKGHQFILAITDYFSKWAEVIPLKEVKTSDVIKFMKHR